MASAPFQLVQAPAFTFNIKNSNGLVFPFSVLIRAKAISKPFLTAQIRNPNRALFYTKVVLLPLLKDSQNC
jgi:hypothetical protein